MAFYDFCKVLHDSYSDSRRRGITAMRSIVFVALFLAYELAIATPATVQEKALNSLPGASVDLDTKLICLKGKKYPDDIERCGVQGFVDEGERQRVESCLRTSHENKLLKLSISTNGEVKRAQFVVVCKRFRVSVIFIKNNESFVADSIGRVVD